MRHLFAKRIGPGCLLAAKTLDNGVTNHVFCGATVDGYTHWVVCIEHVQVTDESVYGNDSNF